ncbi:MAG: ABC transporter ATP-binding protein [Enterococcus sp.]
MEKVVTITSLTKKYGKQTALKDVSLTINQGDIYGLVGRNGAGKTTLLKAILQMIHPTSGEIQLFGATTPKEYTQQLGRVGNIIETPVAYDQLTALQNLNYYCKLYGIVEENAAQKALAFVNLQNTGNKKYKGFSLGMRQKLGLALALLNKPDVLILDEPINGLDPVAIVEIRELLLKLNREQNITIIISSHILDELHQIANRFGFIKDGELVEEMDKEEFHQKASSFIRLETTETSAAISVLASLGILECKVVTKNQINIYQTTVPIEQIIRALTKENIPIQGIILEAESLESYFKELISSER